MNKEQDSEYIESYPGMSVLFVKSPVTGKHLELVLFDAQRELRKLRSLSTPIVDILKAMVDHFSTEYPNASVVSEGELAGSSHVLIKFNRRLNYTMQV